MIAMPLPDEAVLARRAEIVQGATPDRPRRGRDRQRTRAPLALASDYDWADGKPLNKSSDNPLALAPPWVPSEA